MPRFVFLSCIFIWLTGVSVGLAQENELSALERALRADVSAQPGVSPSPGNRLQMEQSVLSLLERRSQIEPTQLEENLRQLLRTNLPEPLQQEVTAALTRIQTDRSQQAKTYAESVNAALGRANAVLAKAQTARELDDTLAELRKLSQSRRGVYQSEMNEAMERARNAAHFVQQWQDYLWAIEGGNFSSAISTLNNLSQSDFTGLDMGRSQILARARALETQEKNQVQAAVTGILQGIHGLDDLPAALAQLHGNQAVHHSQDLQATLNALDAIGKAYLAFKNGVATTLPATYSNPGDTDPLVSQLRTELVLRAVPRILGVEDRSPPNKSETVEQYLERMRTVALNAGDYDLLGRVIATTRQLTFSVGGPGESRVSQEYAAFLFFREGQNEERARRYMEAVLAYRNALRSGTTAIPAEFIGQRLTAIEHDQPDEYRRALEIVRRDDGHPVMPRGYESPSAQIKLPSVSPGPTALRNTPSPSPALWTSPKKP